MRKCWLILSVMCLCGCTHTSRVELEKSSLDQPTLNTLTEQAMSLLCLSEQWSSRDGLRKRELGQEREISLVYPYRFLDTLRHEVNIDIRYSDAAYHISVSTKNRSAQKRRSSHGLRGVSEPFYSCVGPIYIEENELPEEGMRRHVRLMPKQAVLDDLCRSLKIKKEDGREYLTISSRYPQRDSLLLQTILSLSRSHSSKGALNEQPSLQREQP